MADYTLVPPEGSTLAIGRAAKPVSGMVTNGRIEDPNSNGATPLQIKDTITLVTALNMLRVLTVALPGQGGHYNTIQEAVDAASLLTPLSTSYGVIIQIAPGTYNEDVVIKKTGIHLYGVGGQGVVYVKSVTYTNCTDASVTAFNLSGDPTVLVQDNTLTNTPYNNEIRGIEFNRTVNTGSWVGDAIASIRSLGAPVAGSSYMGNELMLWHCTVRAAAGAVAGKGGIYIANSNYISVMDSWIPGGIKCYQTSGLWFDFVTANQVEMYYDDTGALAEPSDDGNYGLSMNSGRISKIVLSGPAGRCGQDYMEGVTIGAVDINATTVSSESFFNNCHVKGSFDIDTVGPTVIFNGGRYMVAISGLGAAGFTGNAGFNS